MNEIEVPEENIKSTTERLTGHVAEYVETYVQLTNVKITEKATDAATTGFTAILISFFGMIVLIFLGLGISAVLKETMSEQASYFIVTSIYAAIGLVFIGFRKKLIFPAIRNKIIGKMYGSKD